MSPRRSPLFLSLAAPASTHAPLLSLTDGPANNQPLSPILSVSELRETEGTYCSPPEQPVLLTNDDTLPIPTKNLPSPASSQASPTKIYHEDHEHKFENFSTLPLRIPRSGFNLFGYHWSITSEELFLPSLCSLVFVILCIIATCIGLGFFYDKLFIEDGNDELYELCNAASDRIWALILTALCVFLLHAFQNIFTIHTGCNNTIFQLNTRVRYTLLTRFLMIIVYSGTFIWNLILFITLFTDDQSCISTKFIDMYNSKYLVPPIIITDALKHTFFEIRTYVIIQASLFLLNTTLLFVFTACLSCVTCHNKSKNHLNSEDADAQKRRQKRWLRRFRLLFCCYSPSTNNSDSTAQSSTAGDDLNMIYERLALLFTEYLSLDTGTPEDPSNPPQKYVITPSDIAIGMLLVQASQKQAQLEGHQHLIADYRDRWENTRTILPHDAPPLTTILKSFVFGANNNNALKATELLTVASLRHHISDASTLEANSVVISQHQTPAHKRNHSYSISIAPSLIDREESMSMIHTLSSLALHKNPHDLVDISFATPRHGAALHQPGSHLHTFHNPPHTPTNGSPHYQGDVYHKPSARAIQPHVTLDTLHADHPETPRTDSHQGQLTPIHRPTSFQKQRKSLILVPHSTKDLHNPTGGGSKHPIPQHFFPTPNPAGESPTISQKPVEPSPSFHSLYDHYREPSQLKQQFMLDKPCLYDPMDEAQQQNDIYSGGVDIRNNNNLNTEQLNSIGMNPTTTIRNEVVPTDVVGRDSLTLQRRDSGQAPSMMQTNISFQFNGDYTSTTPQSPYDLVNASENPYITHDMLTNAGHDQNLVATLLQGIQPDLPLDDWIRLSLAKYYARFAQGVYGWPLLVTDHCFSAICGCGICDWNIGWSDSNCPVRCGNRLYKKNQIENSGCCNGFMCNNHMKVFLRQTNDKTTFCQHPSDTACSCATNTVIEQLLDSVQFPNVHNPECGGTVAHHQHVGQNELVGDNILTINSNVIQSHDNNTNENIDDDESILMSSAQMKHPSDEDLGSYIDPHQHDYPKTRLPTKTRITAQPNQNQQQQSQDNKPHPSCACGCSTHPIEVLHANVSSQGHGTCTYYVCLDHTTHHIVIAIRGTMSISDTVTDLDTELVYLPFAPKYYAHKGMFTATEWLMRQLNGENAVGFNLHHWIQNHRDEYGIQGIVITGHSLGAAVTTILTAMLSQQYMDVLGIAFAPPPCLCPELSHRLKNKIISITHHNDMVPRLSIAALFKLKQQMVNAFKVCIDNRFEIMQHVKNKHYHKVFDAKLVPHYQLDQGFTYDAPATGGNSNVVRFCASPKQQSSKPPITIQRDASGENIIITTNTTPQVPIDDANAAHLQQSIATDDVAINVSTPLNCILTPANEVGLQQTTKNDAYSRTTTTTIPIASIRAAHDKISSPSSPLAYKSAGTLTTRLKLAVAGRLYHMIPRERVFARRVDHELVKRDDNDVSVNTSTQNAPNVERVGTSAMFHETTLSGHTTIMESVSDENNTTTDFPKSRRITTTILSPPPKQFHPFIEGIIQAILFVLSLCTCFIWSPATQYQRYQRAQANGLNAIISEYTICDQKINNNLSNNKKNDRNQIGTENTTYHGKSHPYGKDAYNNCNSCKSPVTSASFSILHTPMEYFNLSSEYLVFPAHPAMYEELTVSRSMWMDHMPIEYDLSKFANPYAFIGVGYQRKTKHNGTKLKTTEDDHNCTHCLQH